VPYKGAGLVWLRVGGGSTRSEATLALMVVGVGWSTVDGVVRKNTGSIPRVESHSPMEVI